MTIPDPSPVFRALADPTRRALFETLCADGEATVVTLTRSAGVSQPAVSKHLRQLREVGLVADRPDGRQTHYRARIEALAPLVAWTGRQAAFWEQKLDGLEDLLRRMDR